MKHYDLVIVGAGVSGMTAAISAAQEGVKDILIIERENALGGILNECIHNGFGAQVLNEAVTGPEYVEYLKEKLNSTHVEVLLNTNVLDIKSNKTIIYVNSNEGVTEISAGCIIFAMGAKERYSGNVNIPTNALTGIFSVGEIHRMINIEGYLPGKNAIITAKDKRAFILARRFIIEGGNLEGIIIEDKFEDILNEEIEDIIDGFDMNIIDNTKVVGVSGSRRIENVMLLNTENNESTKMNCDCLILSVGFIPETKQLKKLKIDIDEETLGPKVNNYQTSLDGFFACGNIVYGEKGLNMGEINGFECGKEAALYVKKYCV